VTLKPSLGVTQGHQNRHILIHHLQLLINIPQ